MIDIRSFRIVYWAIGFISILFSLLAFFDVPYQFYWWELFFDGKAISILFLLIFLWRTGRLTIPYADLRQWRWKGIFGGCFFLLIPLAISAGVGYLVDSVSLERIENYFTRILSSFFDVPAIFVFSATTVLVEELFFRLIFIRSLMQKHSAVIAGALSTVCFLFYKVPDIMQFDHRQIASEGMLALYFLSVGALCAAFFLRYSSVWIGYSFRIGIMVLPPLFLDSYSFESDSLFSTKSMFFNSEGVLVSIIFLLSSVLFVRKQIPLKFFGFSKKSE